MTGKPNARRGARKPSQRSVAAALVDAGDAIAARLLAWYDRHRRVLPWRAAPGERADPYRVWISEIMLQQTTVAAAGPYFQRFLTRFPTVAALAAAPVEDVMHAWTGLGYYARARNLHKAAQKLTAEFGGRLPDTEEKLLELPGIGPYTAAAIAAIAFDRPAAAVDANAERVVARLFAVTEPMPGAKGAIRAHAAGLVPQARAGDFAQALMDLGSGVCTVAAPRCLLCPLAGGCAAHARGGAEDIPVKAAKAARPTRRGVAFWIVDGQGRVLLRRRPPLGLLGGMMEVPSSAWREGRLDRAKALAESPLALDFRFLKGTVRHVFSHFALELAVAVGEAPRAAARVLNEPYVWRGTEELADEALPSAMTKVVDAALGWNESSKPRGPSRTPSRPSRR